MRQSACERSISKYLGKEDKRQKDEICKRNNDKVEEDGQCDQIWQNFRNFGPILTVLGKVCRVYFAFGNTFRLLWLKIYAVGQVFIVVDGQKC